MLAADERSTGNQRFKNMVLTNLVIYSTILRFYDMEAYFEMIRKRKSIITKMRFSCEKLHGFKDQRYLILENTLKQILELEENIKLFMTHNKSR